MLREELLGIITLAGWSQLVIIPARQQRSQVNASTAAVGSLRSPATTAADASARACRQATFAGSAR